MSLNRSTVAGQKENRNWLRIAMIKKSRPCHESCKGTINSPPFHDIIWHFQNTGSSHNFIVRADISWKPVDTTSLWEFSVVHWQSSCQAEIWTVYLLSTRVCSIWKSWPTYFYRVTLNTHPRSWLHFCYLMFEGKWIMNLLTSIFPGLSLVIALLMAASDWLSLFTISSLQIGSLFGDINIW